MGYRQNGEPEAGAWCQTCLLPSGFVVPALMVEMRHVAGAGRGWAAWAETAQLATVRVHVCPDCGGWRLLLPGQETIPDR